MDNILNIKHKNQSQTFEILDDSVDVKLNTDKHQLSYKIPFEEIKKSSHTIHVKNDSKTGILYCSLLFNVILILFIFSDEFQFKLIYVYYCLVPILCFFYLLSNEFNKGFDEKHIDAEKILYFIITKKNKNEVDNFIYSIFEQQQYFFKNKYLKIDPIIPHYRQKERILWLYTNKYISESEYEVINEDLDKYFNFKIDLNK